MATSNELGSVVGEPPGGGNEGDPMVTGNEPGPEVGEPPGGDNKGDPMATGIKLGPEVGEPPGGDAMVFGNELGSVVGEPPGNRTERLDLLGCQKSLFEFPLSRDVCQHPGDSPWRTVLLTLEDLATIPIPAFLLGSGLHTVFGYEFIDPPGEERIPGSIHGVPIL